MGIRNVASDSAENLTLTKLRRQKHPWDSLQEGPTSGCLQVTDVIRSLVLGEGQP